MKREERLGSRASFIIIFGRGGEHRGNIVKLMWWHMKELLCTD